MISISLVSLVGHFTFLEYTFISSTFKYYKITK